MARDEKKARDPLDPAAPAAESVTPASAGPPEGVNKLGPRRAQYMISPRPAPPGFEPLSADFVAEQLKNSPDITFVKSLAPPKVFGLQSTGGGELGSLMLARMMQDKAQLLQNQAGARLTVERDRPLTLAIDVSPIERRMPNPGVLVPHADGFTVTIEVVSDSGPLADADVFIFGSVWPTQGKTGPDGRATMTVAGESPDTIASLYVKPKVDYWSYWLDRPQLVPNTVNSITVKALSSQLVDFPGRQLLGWGERAMGLDRVPPSFDGSGIKVAVVDSGAATSHRNLVSVGRGASVVGERREAWTEDTIGHGSHCAGIIAGGPIINGSGIRGFAPAAEVHVVRIFPGGRFSDLVAALDYCMENGIDVVNLSLGGGEPSRIIEERLTRAKEMGVACIAAAGNSGGPVSYPASSTNCLAVSAIGKWGEFPTDSFHAQQALSELQSADGLFPAKFSCFGPEIDVAGPGVAIVSSLPPDSFGAWDGTSMAAPHVTGLATLVLAHHPDFKGPFKARDARRVERLFEILKASALPLQFGDTNRSGAGLPYAPRALGLEATSGGSMSGATTPASDGSIDASFEALRRLLGLAAHSGVPAGVGASGPGAVQPLSIDIGGPTATVARGPAQTSGAYVLPSRFPQYDTTASTIAELRAAMRAVGVLP
ncbi:MAG: S8 family serine peptidase [Gemmatimonadota bacterium]